MSRYSCIYLAIVLLFVFSFLFNTFGNNARAATTCTDLYTSAVGVPAGFGAVFNLFSPFREPLVKTLLCAGNAASISLGNGFASTYVYKSAYHWTSGGWRELSLTSSSPLLANAWYIGRANGTLSYASGNTQNYYIGYICQRISGTWKCGCSDSACLTPLWQLQRLDVQATGSTGSSGGGRSSGGGGGGRGGGGGNSRPPAPTASLSINPASIIVGDSATLSWSSSNATACSGNNFSTSNQTSGAVTVTPSSTTTYSISCTGSGGTATADVTIAVVQLSSTTTTATLTAASSTITEGQSTTLTWSSDNSTICTGTGFSTGNATSGSVSISPTATTTYSVLCTDTSESAGATTTVGVALVPAINATCSASPTAVATGVVVTWTAIVYGGTGSYTYAWSGTDSLTGTTNPLTTTYSASGTKTAQVDITSGPRTANVSCSNSVTVTEPDTTPPSVSMTAPSGGATVSGTASLSATASDDVAVAGVTFKVNGVMVGAEDTVSPYSISWNSAATSNGTKTIIAVARDTSGNYATSSAATVTVDNTGPIIAAVASSTSVATATVAWTTDESSDSKVVYGLTTAYGSATSSASPVTSHLLTLTGLASSTLYHYAIVSTDAQGNTSTSSDYTFLTATAPDVTAPSVSLTAPANSATVSGTTTTSAIASDNVGIVGVEFFLDGTTLLRDERISPYSFSWNTRTVTDGAYTVAAVARDTAGNRSTSTISVTIRNVTATLTAASSTITEGQSTTLTWSSNNTTLCTGTGFSTSNAVSGSISVSPTATTTYNISCTGTGGSATATATVNVILVPAIVASCSASPIIATTTTIVTWTAIVSGGTGSYTYAWSGTDSLTGTTNPLTTTYSASGTKTAQVDITSGPRTANVSCSNSVLIDTTNPSGAGGLAATPVSSSQVNLGWNTSTDAESGIAGYQIWRCATFNCTPSSAGAQVGFATTNSYSDTGLNASTTYRYQVRSVNNVGLFSIFSTTPKAATTSSADLSINYAASASPGTLNHVAAGFLHGLGTSLGSGPVISPSSLWSSLAPKYLRTRPSSIPSYYTTDKALRGGTTSVMMIATLSGNFGQAADGDAAPWITASNPSSSYENPDYTDWLNYVITRVNTIKAAIPAGQRMYDFWNEPNGLRFWGDWDSREAANGYPRFKELYQLTYKLLKEGLPGYNSGVALDPGVPFTAPGTAVGTANLTETFTTDFMTYAKNNNVVPDFWNWHFGDPVTLERFNTYMSHAASIGASRDAMVLEYLRVDDGHRPGRAIYELAMLEAATATSGNKIVGAAHSRWSETTEGGDALFYSDGAWRKHGIWYMYENYAKMTGDEAPFVSSNTTPLIGAVASIDASTKKAYALLGNNAYDQRTSDDAQTITTSTVGLGGIQSGDGSGSVTVTVSRIPYNNFGEVNDGDIIKVIDAVSYPVVNNAITISIPWGLVIDGYFVEVTNVSPQ